MALFARARTLASVALSCHLLFAGVAAAAGASPTSVDKPATQRIEDPAQIPPQKPVDLSKPPPVIGVPVDVQMRRPPVSYRNDTPNVVIDRFEEPTPKPHARRGRGFGPLAPPMLAAVSAAAGASPAERAKIWGSVTAINTIDFLGHSANADGFLFIPADPHGAAGPDHVVTVANVSIQFHTKAGVQTYDDSLKNFFSGLGTSAPTTYTFDPKVLWDAQSNRWIVVTLEQTDTAAGDPADTSYIFLAVSDDSDPNGTWYMTRITSLTGTGGTKAWFDYPGFAFDEEAVYITGNMFRFNTGAFAGVRLYIVAKSAFYAGSTAVVSGPLDPYAGGGVATTSQPARILGTPPSGAIGTWLAVFSGLASGTNDFVQTMRIDNPLASPTFTLTQLNLGNFDSQAAQPDAPQAGTDAGGTNRTLETNDRRALDAVWRSNGLWMAFTHMPASGADLGQPTARYVKLATSVAGVVTFSEAGNAGGEDIGTGTHTFFPSLSVNAYDQMVMGFSATNASIFPSMYAVSRRATDPAGALSASRLLKAGVAHYYRAFGGSQNRWGDYTSTATDPSNQCFWVYNKWADTKGTILGSLPNEDGRWATTIARVCVCDGDETTPDNDFDGVCENLDNCDAVANRDQADTDGDGIGDACETPAAPSTTVLASSPDPSVFGQSVTLTATVSGGSGTPTGSVTFLDGATSLGTGTLNGSGVATLATSTLGVGSHNLTANYGGNATYAASSGADTQTVDKANTTTTITGDTPDPSVVGQSVTVDFAVVATAPGAGTPTGNVTVSASGGSETCTASVAAGSCSLTLTATGSRTLTAAYIGDSSFNGSTSAGVAHAVDKANTTTTITSDNPDASVVGQSVTVAFSVAANAPGSGTPTGDVVVTVSGGSETCTGTVAAGSCTLALTTAGTRTITASYAGDASFNASSDTQSHTVNKAGTATTVTSDAPDASLVGQAITVAYSVVAVAPGAGTPTGDVVVTVSGGGETCTGTVAAGSCTLALTTAGTRTITASYAGDASFNASSDTEAHSVGAAGTTTTITSDAADPSVFGETITVAYTVVANAPGGGTPAGDVVVTVSGGGETCTGTVAAGQCTLALTALGTRTLTAAYAGNANYDGSSDTETHSVGQANSTTTITSDAPDASVVGQAVTVVFDVAAAAPGAGTPTGTVAVTVSGGPETCSASAAAGSCSLTLTSAGPRTFTAAYAGDANFGASSDTEAHAVDKAATTLAIADDNDPSDIGANVTVTATLAVTAPGAGTPSGTIAVTGTSTTGCTITLPATSCVLSFTASGTKTIDASYSGDANFAAASAAPIAHTVRTANPTLTTPSNQALLEDGATGALGVTVGDVETAAGALTLTATSSDTTLVPNANVVLGGAGASRTVTVTPAANRSGTATITLTASDPDGGSATTAFDVVVTPVNDPPSLAIAGNLGHAAGTSGAQSVPGFVTAFDAGPFETQNVLFYGLAEVADANGVVGGATIAANGTLSYTLTGVGGTALLRATVEDDGGRDNGGVSTSVPIDFTITVDPSADLVVTKANVWPYVVAGATYTWTATVTNAGPNAVADALLSDAPPATLGSVTWTCTPVGDAVCPNASGGGAIAELVDLDVGDALVYAVTATVVGPVGGTVVATAAVEAPSGTADLDPSDNSATDADEIRVDALFKDQYED